MYWGWTSSVWRIHDRIMWPQLLTLHLDSRKYERGKCASKVRNCGRGWEDVFSAKISYGEKLWNVFQTFLKAEDSLIQLGWHTHHLPEPRSEFIALTFSPHFPSPPHPPTCNCTGCSLWKHLPFWFLSSQLVPKMPLPQDLLSNPLAHHDALPSQAHLIWSCLCFCPLVSTQEPAAPTHVPMYRI